MARILDQALEAIIFQLLKYQVLDVIVKMKILSGVFLTINQGRNKKYDPT